MFIGNQQVVNFFDKAIENQALSQVYCLAGGGQVGKRTLAREICARLLGTSVEKLSLHPDFYYLERTENEKTGKMRKEISVDQSRQLRVFLQNQSWNGGYKAVIIDEAETLNEESGNALLKSLEEASEKCIIFLLTEDENALLSTIRSRTQMITMFLQDKIIIKDGLEKMGCDQKKAEEICEYANGKMGRAVDFFENQEKFSVWKNESMRWRGLALKPLYQRFKEVEDLFIAKEEMVRTQDRLSVVLNIWMEEAEKMLKEKVENNDQTGMRSGLKSLESITEVSKLLAQNINPKMLIEKIILQF
ncbi:MAG: hypothetical protein Q7S24_00765 [bacterium]|nr:hypothetical protein [bacterium]